MTFGHRTNECKGWNSPHLFLDVHCKYLDCCFCNENNVIRCVLLSHTIRWIFMWWKLILYFEEKTIKSIFELARSENACRCMRLVNFDEFGHFMPSVPLYWIIQRCRLKFWWFATRFFQMNRIMFASAPGKRQAHHSSSLKYKRTPQNILVCVSRESGIVSLFAFHSQYRMRYIDCTRCHRRVLIRVRNVKCFAFFSHQSSPLFRSRLTNTLHAHKHTRKRGQTKIANR